MRQPGCVADTQGNAQLRQAATTLATGLASLIPKLIMRSAWGSGIPCQNRHAVAVTCRHSGTVSLRLTWERAGRDTAQDSLVMNKSSGRSKPRSAGGSTDHQG